MTTELLRILIADDEETFLYSTADLLRREGYHCDTAPDATTAAPLVARGDYDVVIADIRMPGNSELQFVQELAKAASGLPVILVTGYPSLRSAIQSIDLLVVAYLIKPIEFQELLARVRECADRRHAYRSVLATRRRLDEWQQNLATLEDVMKRRPGDASYVPVSTFLDLTLRNVVHALADFKAVAESMAGQRGQPDVCRLIDCPRPVALLQALRETIAVIEKTKSSFKSKELGELRQKLEDVVQSASQGLPV